MKTFKPGDYCRFTPEEIPTIIELLKANGWNISSYTEWTAENVEDCICIIFETDGFIPNQTIGENELSRHKFLVTALRLNEGDGLRADMSTPEEMEHIAEVLIGLGVNYQKESMPSYVEFHGFILGIEGKLLTVFDEVIKNHIDYLDWCKRLNVTPIGEDSDIFESQPFSDPKMMDAYRMGMARGLEKQIFEKLSVKDWLTELKKTKYSVQAKVYEKLSHVDSEQDVKQKQPLAYWFGDDIYYNILGTNKYITDDLREISFDSIETARHYGAGAIMEQSDLDWIKKSLSKPVKNTLDVGETITLPDGTTVDLTKPFEVSDANKNNWHTPNKAHYIGTDAAGMHVVHFILSTGEDHYEGFKHIRNKPEPEFKAIVRNYELHNFGSKDFETMKQIMDNQKGDEDYLILAMDYNHDLCMCLVSDQIKTKFPPFND